MRARDRDIVAGVIAAIALILGGVAWVDGRVDPGVTIGLGSGPAKTDSVRLVVTSVNDGSPAAYAGLQVGMIVTSLNSFDLTALPAWDLSRAFIDGDGPFASPIPFVPDPTPTVVPPSAAVLGSLLDQPIYSIVAVQPDTLDHLLDPQQMTTFDFDVGTWSYPVRAGWLAWAVGVLILIVGGWWLATGHAESVRGLAIPAVVATATPLLLDPFRAIGGQVPFAVSSVVAALALLPLADGLITRLPTRNLRFAASGGSVAMAAVAAVLGGIVFGPGDPNDGVVLWWLSAAGVTAMPGILAARPTVGIGGAGDAKPSTSSRRLLEATEFAVLGLTPAIAFLSLVLIGDQPFLLPILVWTIAILVAGRFTVRPLVRLATRAQLQRDLVVATMEAERARIATNIHDDALQDVTLLVRRLDDAGDGEGAELARGVADRLRTISGDLRLPILDDLGVGPALDWLVSRTERMAGGEVRLELADGTRPPADVELAVFRIAQEALTNAVKHGRPPIVVRYRAMDTGVSLSVDDAGPGIEPGAAEHAPSAGHFGILGMSQRAEQIGAILDVRRWPTGGTHVALEWRPR